MADTLPKGALGLDTIRPWLAMCGACDAGLGMNCTHPDGDYRTPMAALVAEVERLHTWAGLMSLLDEHYPAEIITGESGDPGPRIVALTRAVNGLRESVDVARRFAEVVEAQNAAALVEHVMEPGDSSVADTPWCFSCRTSWPCPTAQALGAVL